MRQNQTVYARYVKLHMGLPCTCYVLRESGCMQAGDHIQSSETTSETAAQDSTPSTSYSTTTSESITRWDAKKRAVKVTPPHAPRCLPPRLPLPPTGSHPPHLPPSHPPTPSPEWQSATNLAVSVTDWVDNFGRICREAVSRQCNLCAPNLTLPMRFLSVCLCRS